MRYVAGLAGDGHRTMTGCLQAIAAWVSDGAADIDTLPWADLRFSHTTAIRAALARAVSKGATPRPRPTSIWAPCAEH
jgi:hypothetical protein